MRPANARDFKISTFQPNEGGKISAMTSKRERETPEVHPSRIGLGIYDWNLGS